MAVNWMMSLVRNQPYYGYIFFVEPTGINANLCGCRVIVSRKKNKSDNEKSSPVPEKVSSIRNLVATIDAPFLQ